VLSYRILLYGPVIFVVDRRFREEMQKWLSANCKNIHRMERYSHGRAIAFRRQDDMKAFEKEFEKALTRH